MNAAQQKLAALPLRAWACGFHGDDHETIINARSRGQAKVEFLRDIDWEVKYIDVFARAAGPARKPQTTPGIRRVAKCRGVPFVTGGMRVCVGKDFGVIVGHNESANFDVRFDSDSRYPDAVLNCHPNHEIAYFDEDGEIIRDFRKGLKP